MNFQSAFDPFRAIRASWEVLKRSPIAIIVGGLIVLSLTDSEETATVKELWQGEVRVSFDNLPSVFWHATAGALSLTGMIFALLLACFFVTTFAGTVERVVRTGRGQAADLLDSRGRFLKQLLASLLGAGIYGLAAVPFWLFTEGSTWFGDWLAIPGLILGFVIGLPIYIYAHLGLRFVAQAVAIEGLDPIPAIKRSWSLVDGHRWQLVIYLFVVNVFAVLGLLACFVGVFVTGAMKAAAINESYLRLISSAEEQATWAQEPLESGWSEGGQPAEGSPDRDPSA